MVAERAARYKRRGGNSPPVAPDAGRHGGPWSNGAMPFRIKVSLAILLALLGLLVLGPLVIPVRPLEATVAAEDLADPDSRFVDVLGTELHFKMVGDPAAPGPAFVLLHGFGASVYTWHEVLGPLGEAGTAMAFDRPGFGLSERPDAGSWERGENPYAPARQVDLTIGLMDALGIGSAIVVGNSAGGAIAAEIALAHPERVAGLILIDAAIYRAGGPPAWSRPLLHTPQMSRVGPLLMRSLAGEPGDNLVRAAWSDPERVDEETLAAYRAYTRIEGWDRAVWEVSKAARESHVARRLDQIRVPTLVVTGADDAVVQPDEAERLAAGIPDAELVVLPACGHVPQEECPGGLVESILRWLDAPSRTASG